MYGAEGYIAHISMGDRPTAKHIYTLEWLRVWVATPFSGKRWTRPIFFLNSKSQVEPPPLQISPVLTGRGVIDVYHLHPKEVDSRPFHPARRGVRHPPLPPTPTSKIPTARYWPISMKKPIAGGGRDT